MDPADPDYTLTDLEDVDEELIARSVAWAESHTGTVDTLVATL